ncbi:unnamed protein product [Leptidea sinapis]|uniref:DNA/RNA non-specific endonuclease/pyrophosphatase/phosphodiesterase domain-containing protein n=1 Tax=Leptidea sinapis TaxID=189913 RepID=A0A5E4QVZ9_9NEOP|nr:unnamed protein product [Leptidea sinapis]
MYHKIYLLILCAINSHHAPTCRLNTRQHFGEPLPIILRDGRIVEPDNKYGDINLNDGDLLTISCEGSGYIQHPNVRENVVTGMISCAGGDNFINDRWLVAPSAFTMFRCPIPPDHNSRVTNRTCYEGHPIIEVGYNVQNEFYPVYESCFDNRRFNPIYSKYTQKSYNAMFQTRVERPFFKDNSHYINIQVNSLFSPGGLRSAVERSIGSQVDTFVTKNQMLSRGHLAAKTDFVFAFTERATFHYVNCAPQWTGFNGGNWNTLEVDLRNHIHSADYNTIIYTGTYGVTALQNQLGTSVDLYLSTDHNNNRIIVNFDKES